MESTDGSARARGRHRGELSPAARAWRTARFVLAGATVIAAIMGGCSTGGSSTTSTPGSLNTKAASTTPSNTASTTATGASTTTPIPTGGGSSTTSSNATTLFSPAGARKPYEDAAYHYAFEYPSDWQLTEDVSVAGSAGGSSAKTVGAFDLRGDRNGDTLLDGVVISVYELTTTVDESLMSAFKDELASALPHLESQLTDPVSVEPLRDVSINGVPGFETIYMFKSGGKTLRSRMLFLVRGDIEYQISVQSVDGSWQKMLPGLNRILNSFHTLP